jgi:hypothetical protein
MPINTFAWIMTGFGVILLSYGAYQLKRASESKH